jgi:uncharacterized membrane protein YozB (DUF420 family)
MSYPITPQANLGLQITVLALILVGLVLKRMRKYLLHAASMLTAAVLNLISFFAIMWPNFLRMSESFAINISERLSLVTIGHAAFGASAEILAMLVIALWGFRSSAQNCFKYKRLMRIIFMLWVIALVLGILFYVLAYTSFLG